MSTKKPVSAVTPDDNDKSKSGHEGRVAELRQQLREAEVEAALQKQTATMHGVTHDQVEAGGTKLGPAAYAKVELEGCHVKALVDTGSPATIVAPMPKYLLQFQLNNKNNRE